MLSESGKLRYAETNMFIEKMCNRKLIKSAALLFLTVIAISPLQAAELMTLTEAQNGKSVTIAKGASVVISLESNPTTGYVWQVGKNDNAVLKLAGAPAFEPGAKQMPGAPGHQLFKFEAVASGSDVIALDYVRPWEKDLTPARKFSVVVTVK